MFRVIIRMYYYSSFLHYLASEVQLICVITTLAWILARKETKKKYLEKGSHFVTNEGSYTLLTLQ